MDGGLTREQHHETVDADAHAGGRGHTIFQSAQEVLVDEHGLVVAALAEFHLLLEACTLVDGVVQLGVGVGQFLAVDHQLEALGQFGVVAVTLAERRHLHGIVGDEGRLDVGAFALLAEDFIDQLALAHRVVHLDAELFAHVAQLGFIHTRDVDAGLLLDGVNHRNALEGTLEADFVVANFHGISA